MQRSAHRGRMGQRTSGLFQLSSRWAKELPFLGGLSGSRLNDHWSFYQPTQQINEVQPTKGYYIWIPNHHDHSNFLTSTNPIGSMWLVYLPTFFIKESTKCAKHGGKYTVPPLVESVIDRGGRSNLQGDKPWGEDCWVRFPKIDKDKKMMMYMK